MRDTKLGVLILHCICFLNSELGHAEVPEERYKHGQSILVQTFHIKIIQINMNLYKCWAFMKE